MHTVQLARKLVFMTICFSLPILFCSQTLVAAGKEAEAKKALDDLKKAKDAKTKAASLQKIGEIGLIQYAFVESAIPEVYKALKDSDATVKAAAAKTLGMISPEDTEAVPQLAALLKDKDENVKLAAAEGLGYMGKKAASVLPDLRAAQKAAENKSKLSKTLQNVIKTISGSKK